MALLNIDTSNILDVEYVPAYYEDAMDTLADYLQGADLETLAEDISNAVICEYGRGKTYPTLHEVGEAVVKCSSLSYMYYSSIIATRYGEEALQHFEDYDTEKEDSDWADNFALALLSVFMGVNTNEN